MSYVSGSLETRHSITPSGYEAQLPSGLPNSAFATAYQPTAAQVYEKCDSVIINGTSGSCFLLYNTTSSVGTQLLVAADKEHSASFAGDVVGGTVAESEIGAKVYGDSSPSTQFEIPVGAVAFSGSDGFSSGNITFVKRGGL